jgi:hypothetical protein
VSTPIEDVNRGVGVVFSIENFDNGRLREFENFFIFDDESNCS